MTAANTVEFDVKGGVARFVFTREPGGPALVAVEGRLALARVAYEVVCMPVPYQAATPPDAVLRRVGRGFWENKPTDAARRQFDSLVDGWWRDLHTRAFDAETLADAGAAGVAAARAGMLQGLIVPGGIGHDIGELVRRLRDHAAWQQVAAGVPASQVDPVALVGVDAVMAVLHAETIKVLRRDD